jgi:ABC-type sugar transport system substrate-binding protein
VNKYKCVVSVPGHAMYLEEQIKAVNSAAARLGTSLEILNAEMDPVLQSQQLLQFVQSRTEKPNAILVEPVSAVGLPRVAEAAVAADVAWAVSNAQVDYISMLRKKARVPVFLISQDHVEVGRIQARQVAALLPEGGGVLYLRGPAMSSIAQRRFEGLDGGKPKNIELKSIKVQGSTAENATAAVCSWLNLSMGKPGATQLIVAQNADFILGARRAFETNTLEPDRSKWLAIPCLGVGLPIQMNPLVDTGLLRAAVLTSLTMDVALDMLVRGLAQHIQPREFTYVEAHSYPNLDDLAKKRRR